MKGQVVDRSSGSIAHLIHISISLTIPELAEQTRVVSV